MATLLYMPRLSYLDANGTPRPGALANFYLTQTTTPVIVYQDADLSTEHANPVVAGNDGYFPAIYTTGVVALKMVATDRDGGNPQETDPVSAITLSSEEIAGALDSLKLTQAEIDAGVTPANYAYPPGCVNRYANNTSPNTTDMTAAMQAAYAQHIAGGAEVTFLDQIYLVTDTAFEILNAHSRVTIRGTPQRTIILNKAPTGHPTFNLKGAQYFDIRGLVLIGATGFVNAGIQLLKDVSGNRCAFGTIKSVVCQTNGTGLRIQDTNTLTIEDYSYWPSSGSSFGGTIDTGGQPAGILADGAGAVNSVYLYNINISGLNTIVNGGCGIKLDGSLADAPFQDWKIDGLNCEAGPVTTRRAIWCLKVYNSTFVNCFTENMQVLFDKGCRGNSICIQAGASGTLQFDGTAVANIGNLVHDSIGLSFTADSANSGTVQINNSWQVSPGDADSSVDGVKINVKTTGGTLQADKVGASGIKERNRTVSLGEWTTPTFSAGDYTATVGTWTVGSGDVRTMEWCIVGKKMTVNFWLDTTTTASNATQLLIAIPGSFVAAKASRASVLYSEDNETTTSRGVVAVAATGTAISIRKDFPATAFGNVTNLLGVFGSITFEVQ